MQPLRASGNPQDTVPPLPHLPGVTQVGGVGTPGVQTSCEMQQPRPCLLCLSPARIGFLPVRGFCWALSPQGCARHREGEPGPSWAVERRDWDNPGKGESGLLGCGESTWTRARSKECKSILGVGPAAPACRSLGWDAPGAAAGAGLGEQKGPLILLWGNSAAKGDPRDPKRVGESSVGISLGKAAPVPTFLLLLLLSFSCPGSGPAVWALCNVLDCKTAQKVPKAAPAL